MLQLVDHSPWCCDDYVWDVCKLLRLPHHVHASNNNGDAQVQGLARKDQELVTDLEGQLSCRSHDKSEDAEWILG